MNSPRHSSSTVTGFCGCAACLSAEVPAASIQGRNAFSRRGFLGRAAAGVAMGLLPVAGLDLASVTPARAQSTMTPDQALQEMMAGNKRFTEGKLKSFDEDLAILKQKTAEKQEPFAAVLACADSRVPVELIFDQSIGHLFVNRVAGNIATGEMIASLEYGAAVLGTRTIMVLAHSNCGAVSASIAAKAVPGQISTLYRYIRPAIDQAGSDVDAVARANAKIQAGILRDASPLLAELIGKKSLSIVAGFYNLASGTVDLLA